MQSISISGSVRTAMRGSKATGPARPDERFEVTVRLRGRGAIGSEPLKGRRPPRARTYLTHGQFEKRFGARGEDIAQVRAFAREAGLKVVEVSAARRTMILSGTTAKYEKAFGVKLMNYEHPRRGTFRGHVGAVSAPAELHAIVVGIFGLDNRPFARPHKVRRRMGKEYQFAGYTSPQVGRMYGFPAGLDGTNQTIGIIELGGGYRGADLTAYFKRIGVSSPQVTAVSVDQGRNSPSTPNGADGEVMLDIEVSAGIASKAKIAVYFAAGSSEKDFLDAMTTAVHDTVNNPSVISISWGGPEDSASGGFQQEFNKVLRAAAALGITVTVASGDSGAADEGPDEWDGKAHVDFPASSPFALACGGTSIRAANNTITAEKAWNQNMADSLDDTFGATGGGVSAVFALPGYQKGANVPVSVSTGKRGRGVPDVSGDADPASGYLVRVDGQEFPIGGTSAVAPLWAGLIALCNQAMGARAGFIHPILYANAAAFNDITQGSNRVGASKVGYGARPGWDACTGLGSPNGAKILAALGGAGGLAAGKSGAKALAGKPGVVASSDKPSAAAVVVKPGVVPPNVKPVGAAPAGKPSVAVPSVKPSAVTPVAKAVVAPSKVTPVVSALAGKPSVAAPSVKPSAAVVVAKPVVAPSKVGPMVAAPVGKPSAPAAVAKPVVAPPKVKSVIALPVGKPSVITPSVKPSGPAAVSKPNVTPPKKKPVVAALVGKPSMGAGTVKPSVKNRRHKRRGNRM